MSEPNAVRVKIDRTKTYDQTAKTYWLGLFTECPFASVDVAGISFPKVVSPRVKIGAEMLPTYHEGIVRKLTEHDVELVQEAIVKKYVRKVGNTSVLLSSAKAGTFIVATDEPLAKYAYMIEVDDATPRTSRPMHLTRSPMAEE